VIQRKISSFIKTRKTRNGYSERILPRAADISTCISTRIRRRQGIYIFITGCSRNAYTTRKISFGLRSSMRAGSNVEFDGEKSSMNMWLTTACETVLCRLFTSNLKVQNNQPRATTVRQDKPGRTPTQSCHHRFVERRIRNSWLYSRSEECEARSSQLCQQGVFCCHLQTRCNPSSFWILILSPDMTPAGQRWNISLLQDGRSAFSSGAGPCWRRIYSQQREASPFFPHNVRI